MLKFIHEFPVVTFEHIPLEWKDKEFAIQTLVSPPGYFKIFEVRKDIIKGLPVEGFRDGACMYLNERQLMEMKPKSVYIN